MFHSCKCFWMWNGERECAVPHTLGKPHIFHQSQIINLNGPKVTINDFLRVKAGTNKRAFCLICMSFAWSETFFKVRKDFWPLFQRNHFHSFIQFNHFSQPMQKQTPFQCLVTLLQPTATGHRLFMIVVAVILQRPENTFCFVPF